ncbi:MAG: FHA domain-containing protein [Anaerolineae bacterium]|nr:FHA domain-containing protein [Anaerolineae bacterium]
MTNGGGFCERHGPFDPPYTSCPYCALESDERNAYGPPENTAPSASHAEDAAVDAPAPADITSEPDATDPQPRDAAVDASAAEYLDAADYVPDDAPGLSSDAGDDEGDEFVLATYEPEPHAALDLDPDASNVTEIVPRREVLSEVREDDADADAEHEPLAWLVVKQPAQQRGATLTVRANQSIGREGDVQWDDSRLSRQHAKLTFEPPPDADPDSDAAPVFHIWPFGPTNPVFVNGEAIRGATPLHENDEITLGNTLFVFKVLLD